MTLPTNIPEEMRDYVRQVAAEMRVDEQTAWEMIMGGEGGGSTPPPTEGTPAAPAPAQSDTRPLGRRDIAAEVAQSGAPMAPATAKPPGVLSMFQNMFGDMTPEERMDMWNPKGNTLGGKVTDMLGLTDPESRKYAYGGHEARPQTLFALGAKGLGLGKDKPKSAELVKAQDKMAEGYNAFAPMGVSAQMAALEKKKKQPTVGSTLWSYFT